MANNNAPLVDAVRNWVHFDNLCTNLTKQITTARNLRGRYEEQVLGLLGNTKRLRISGCYLEPCTKNSCATLNWTTLEEQLNRYFTDCNKPNETMMIIKFMKENRGQKSTLYLKKLPLNDENLITATANASANASANANSINTIT